MKEIFQRINSKGLEYILRQTEIDIKDSLKMECNMEKVNLY